MTSLSLPARYALRALEEHDQAIVARFVQELLPAHEYLPAQERVTERIVDLIEDWPTLTARDVVHALQRARARPETIHRLLDQFRDRLTDPQQSPHPGDPAL